MAEAQNIVDILELASLERYCLQSGSVDLSSKDGRRKAFLAYLAMREKIAVDYLPIINSAAPFINDHSRRHLQRVLAHIESLLQRHFPTGSGPIADIPSTRSLTWADTMILLNALIWHDIGNMHGRHGHAARVHECFGAVSGYLYEEPLADYIKQVAEAHSGADAISRLIPASHAVGSYQGEDVHPQFLASVLRFADELDEDQRRISPAEWSDLDIVPAKNKRFWFFCQANTSIRVTAEPGPQILKAVVEISSHVPAQHFDLKFPSDASEVSALQEYFRRLIKLDNERRYCNQFMRTGYYHPGVDSLRVVLRTHDKGRRPSDGVTYKFDITDYNSFDKLLSDDSLADIHTFIEQAIKTP
jgi:hypothetical protein